jgi:hypothetical protein
MLTNVTMSPSGAAGTVASTDPAGRNNTGRDNSAATGGSAPVGTTGGSTASPTDRRESYSLSGSGATELARYVGQRVEVVGTLEQSATGSAGSRITPPPAAGAPAPAAPSPATPSEPHAGAGAASGSAATTGAAAAAHRINVASVRSVSGTCP